MVYEGANAGYIKYEIGPGVVAIGAGSELLRPSVALEVEDFDVPLRQSYRSRIIWKYSSPASSLRLFTRNCSRSYNRLASGLVTSTRRPMRLRPT